jgi:predicted kinase
MKKADVKNFLASDSYHVVMVGPPGSGKSTFAQDVMPVNYQRVSPDSMRYRLSNAEGCMEVSGMAFFLCHRIWGIRAERHIGTIFDATSVKAQDRKKLLSIMAAHNTTNQSVAIVMTTSEESCQDRNSKRDRVVPSEVISRMYNTMQNTTNPLDDGFDHVFYIPEDPEAEILYEARPTALEVLCGDTYEETLSLDVAALKNLVESKLLPGMSEDLLDIPWVVQSKSGLDVIAEMSYALGSLCRRVQKDPPKSSVLITEEGDILNHTGQVLAEHPDVYQDLHLGTELPLEIIPDAVRWFVRMGMSHPNLIVNAVSTPSTGNRLDVNLEVDPKA